MPGTAPLPVLGWAGSAIEIAVNKIEKNLIALMKSESESRSVVSTLCDSMNYTVHGILQARILEWVALSLLQGIFPTQGSNPGLPHCRQILHQLSHKVSPGILEWVAYPFYSGPS